MNDVGKRETFTPEQQRDRARKGMAHMSKLFNAAGLTSVHHARATQEQILAYEDCRKHGELTHRASLMIRSGPVFDALKAANIHTGFVLLEKDPRAVPASEILAIKVNRTVVGGKTVFGS